jgi:hypothetical protein
MARFGQLALDVIDGEVSFAYGDDQFADAIAGGGVLGSIVRRLEKGGAFVGIVAELVTENAEGSR